MTNVATHQRGQRKVRGPSIFERIGRAPLWAWYVATTLMLYWLWNPVSWLPDIWSVLSAPVDDGLPIPLRVIFLAATGGLLYLAWKVSREAIGIFGKLFVVGFLGLFIWLAWDLGWLDVTNVTFWQWIWQPIIGAVLTIGMNWQRIKFKVFYTRSTSEVGDGGHHDHDHDHTGMADPADLDDD